jgi:putative transposase
MGADQAVTPKVAEGGDKPAVDLREIINAIRYMARSRGDWRMLPTNFGPWQTTFWVVPPLCTIAAVPHHRR